MILLSVWIGGHPIDAKRWVHSEGVQLNYTIVEKISWIYTFLTEENLNLKWSYYISLLCRDNFIYLVFLIYTVLQSIVNTNIHRSNWVKSCFPSPLCFPSLFYFPSPPLLEIDGTRPQIKRTQPQIDGIQLQIDGTQLQIHGTQLQIDGTRLEKLMGPGGIWTADFQEQQAVTKTTTPC